MRMNPKRFFLTMTLLSVGLTFSPAISAQLPADLVVASSGKVAPAAFEDAKAKREVADISKALGKKLNFFESKYFTWCTSKSEAQMKKIKNNADTAFQVFAKDAKIDSWKPLWGDQKAMICVFANKSDYKRYIEWYAKTYPVWDKKAFSTGNKKVDFFHETQQRRVIACHLKPHDMEYIEQVVVYEMGVLGANRLYFHQNFTPPWLEAATGSWLEAKVTKKLVCSTTRSSYGATPFKVDMKPSAVFKKFHKLAKRNLANNSLKNIKGLMKVRPHKIDFRDVQKGYAIVHWMRSQPGKYSQFVRALKRHWPSDIVYDYTEEQGKAQERALKEVFDMSMPEIDKAVAKHAKKKF